MIQKVMVAMDDSKTAMRASEYVAKVFRSSSTVTLFSVISEASQCDATNPQLHPYFISIHDSSCVLAEEKIKVVSEAMEKAKEKFSEAGFREDQITVKVQNKQKGIARDIVGEANSGYDTLVMGRRGLSGVKEFILGSVSQKVVQTLHGVTVILVE